jgi:hypothetical protein
VRLGVAVACLLDDAVEDFELFIAQGLVNRTALNLAKLLRQISRDGGPSGAVGIYRRSCWSCLGSGLASGGFDLTGSTFASGLGAVLVRSTTRFASLPNVNDFEGIRYPPFI